MTPDRDPLVLGSRTDSARDRSRIVTADCVDGVADERFDAVLCGPPTHAGDSVLVDLSEGTRSAFAPDGHGWVVHHRALDLGGQMRPFDLVETVATGAEHVGSACSSEWGDRAWAWASRAGQPPALSRRSSYSSTKEASQDPQQK